MNGAAVIAKVVAAGGSVTLLGHPAESGGWRFALVTTDVAGELLQGMDVPTPKSTSLTWVDSWEEGLRLVDRYPWARLHPMAVHPEFVERVRVAVEERLAGRTGPEVERTREKWQRLFSEAAVP